MTRENLRSETDKLAALLEVTRALSTVKDVPKLLKLILVKALEITSAEGASISIVERKKIQRGSGCIPDYQKLLHFYYTVNLSQGVSITNKTVPLTDESIAGYVAVHGEILHISDCYKLGKKVSYSFNSSFDMATGYRTKSMIALPIKTAEGEILGVLQLINKLKPGAEEIAKKQRTLPEDLIISFPPEDCQLMEAFAVQAAISIKNTQLQEEISDQFKSFVKACVTAIEQRDPSTSGHSARVAILTTALAKKVNEVTTGPLKDVFYTQEELYEIRVASLLHDFGKIVVKERILLKAKKLYPNELEKVLLRLKTIRSEERTRQIELAMENNNKEETYKNIDAFEAQMDQVESLILKANEPQVMEGDLNIEQLLHWIDQLSNQLKVSILTEDEKAKLSIKRGNLTDEERREMNNHVADSIKFLERIQWSPALENVPYIAGGHHEKLDGSGYPNGLNADEIPLPARMMAIADMYDSLTASDRPYKKATPVERTLSILNEEASHGKLDADLLKIFIEERVYTQTAPRKKKAA